jgi:exonuclease VII small subunit
LISIKVVDLCFCPFLYRLRSLFDTKDNLANTSSYDGFHKQRCVLTVLYNACGMGEGWLDQPIGHGNPKGARDERSARTAMRLQTKLALTLVAGSLLLGGVGTAYGAEDTVMKKPIPASSFEIQTPELQKADARIEDAKGQLDLARKQLRASQALLKAAEADLRAAESDRKAIALKNQAHQLAEDAQLQVPNKTQMAAKPPKEVTSEAAPAAASTPGTPLPGAEARPAVDFNAEPMQAEPAVAPQADIPQLR